MADLTPIALFESVVEEKRWLQGEWHRYQDGKDYLCLAAAWGKPDEIHEVEDCPAGLFPQWLFRLMPNINDGVAAMDAAWLFRSFAERAKAMAGFSPEAWGQIRTGYMIGLVRQAVDDAAAVQEDMAADHWKRVAVVCEGVVAALEKGNSDDLGKLQEMAWEAAWAAKEVKINLWSDKRAEAAEMEMKEGWWVRWKVDKEAELWSEKGARAAEAAAETAAWAAAEGDVVAEAQAWAIRTARSKPDPREADTAAQNAQRKSCKLLFGLIDEQLKNG